MKCFSLTAAILKRTLSFRNIKRSLSASTSRQTPNHQSSISLRAYEASSSGSDITLYEFQRSSDADSNLSKEANFINSPLYKGCKQMDDPMGTDTDQESLVFQRSPRARWIATEGSSAQEVQSVSMAEDDQSVFGTDGSHYTNNLSTPSSYHGSESTNEASYYFDELDNSLEQSSANSGILYDNVDDEYLCISVCSNDSNSSTWHTVNWD